MSRTTTPISTSWRNSRPDGTHGSDSARTRPFSAELVDLGAPGFAIRQNGADRQIPFDQVAAIDFVGGTIPDSQWALAGGGRHALWLRSGLVVQGEFYDVGGTRPLRITFDTASGRRDFASSEVARILLSPPAGQGPAKSPGTPTAPLNPMPPGGFACNPNEVTGTWTSNSWGEITLRAKGGCSVAGSYTASGGGQISGVVIPPTGDVKNQMLQFRWTRSDGNDGGDAYALVVNASRIEGRWCRPAGCNTSQGGIWGATRTSAPPPAIPTGPVAGPGAGASTCSGLASVLGSWSVSAFGRLNLQSAGGCQVTGTYNNSPGVIRGVMSGARLFFRWTRNDGNDSGEGYLEAGPGGTVQGKWCRSVGCDVMSGSLFGGGR
ncbi:MAG: hypothetical protein A3H96_22220 [Acidobacteria bacterium RIFCSPLOWO2_02_FULL_67_36]|nr:MAG: hypothetical protein A3H96_22220 [Acidobacteria bacterium RIFCSPLOWO2_02_FULL_67_36]